MLITAEPGDAVSMLFMFILMLVVMQGLDAEMSHLLEMIEASCTCCWLMVEDGTGSGGGGGGGGGGVYGGGGLQYTQQYTLLHTDIVNFLSTISYSYLFLII